MQNNLSINYSEALNHQTVQDAKSRGSASIMKYATELGLRFL
jgi:hypothetical protein